MKISTYVWLLWIPGTFLVSTLQAMNLVQPYYAFMKPRYDTESTLQWFVYGEKGFNFKGRNNDSCPTNPLALWQPRQNSLAMLKGFDSHSAQGQLLSLIQADNPDCFWLCMDAELKEHYAFGFGARYRLPYDFSIGLYLPFYKVSLSLPCWRTQSNVGCERADAALYHNFRQNVKELGQCLSLYDWTRTGFGDVTCLLEWTRDFKQPKDILKNVRLNCRCGPSFPTGKRLGEDELLAFPFGHDGCAALVFGGSIELTLATYVRAGVDVELTHIFGNIRDRRIKIDAEQTDLLLLKKGCVYIDPGLIQHFNLFAGVHDICGGLYIQGDYEFYKHGETRYSLISNEHSNFIANDDEALESWTAHHGIIKVGYDFAHCLSEKACVVPTCTFYVRTPIGGVRSVLTTSVGLLCSFDF